MTSRRTVKQLIIGDYLFGEIGEFFKFAKISCHQIETLQSLDITSMGNRQIAIYLKKTPNIIAAKYSCFTVLINEWILGQNRFAKTVQ